MNKIPLRYPVLAIISLVITGLLFTKNNKRADYLCSNCNVILISVDTLKADHMGIFGYSRNTTPNIDSFFANGAVFQNHISQSINTLPSHMSLLTSLYPQEHRVMLLTDPKLSDSHKTLAEILKNNGYATFGLYTGTEHLNAEFGFDRGFDVYLAGTNSEEFVLEELNKIKQNGRKFFLFLHPFNPHGPYVIPKKDSKRFADPNYKGKIDGDLENYPQSVTSDFQKFDAAFWAKVNPQSPADIQHLIDLYDAKIFLTDERLGQVFARLKENKQLDNAIVLLVADHGEEFYEHGRNNHGQLYDEGIKIPLLIRTHKQKTSFRTAALTQNIDVAPTILNLLGLSKEPGFSGKSLVPLITKTVAKVNDYAISQWAYSTDIRTLDWKLLLYKAEGTELYNLKTDPKEKENIITNYPDRVTELKAQLNLVFKKLEFEYKIPPNKNLDQKTREKLIREGYF